MPVPEDIKRAFASGATILTANVRASRWLRREYGLEQRRAGRRAWAAPAIWDWDTWVRNLWQARALAEADAPPLLTSLQERRVWTRMQRDDAELLVSPARVAALAEGAYARLSDYEAHTERNHAWGNADAERFRQWASEFDRECARRKWISRAGLEARVAASLNPELLPRETLLVGFDRTTPAEASLLRALGACGVTVTFAEAAIADSRTEFVRAVGLREEIAACAWWARSQVERNPEARIGVLVPELGSMRSEIERIFRRVLMPQADIFADQPMPFEFSLGQPLAHVPAIRAALLLLRWLDEPLREEEVSWLLLSGFLGLNDAEYLALARDDARRRDSGALSLEIALSVFLKQSRGLQATLIKKLENARRAVASNEIADKERLPGRWVDVAQLLLRETGWPGSAERGAVHFQVVRRWERTLDEIALLDFDGQRMGYGGFLKELGASALETIFSPESAGAPVQIMGALEASGQQFDALWFLGADDASWPPRGQPHPLLPNEVQQRFQMPYSDAEADLQLAKAVTERISASAPVVVFSYAERNKDGELRPSPLLQSAEWTSVKEAPMIDRQLALDEIADASGKITWPLDRSPGGADVLKKQAACAFQAFAAKRLQAKELNRNEWGLSAAERGIVLHRTLERIWSPAGGALHSLDELRAAIDEGRLSEVVRSAIADVFAQFDVAGDAWIEAYLLSEQRRLQVRLEEWMMIEADRVPFKVTACEEKLEGVNVGGLQMRLRADRIDEVADGARILIDYKGGEVSTRDWEPPRLNEPQLPLYAVFGNVDNVRGVLFARIRAGQTGFEGCVEDAQAQLSADAGPASKLMKEPYTDAMRDAWHDALLRLAGDFLRGEAAVNPKDGKKTCRLCSFAGLCRVAEARNSLDEDGGAEANGNGE